MTTEALLPRSLRFEDRTLDGLKEFRAALAAEKDPYLQSVFRFCVNWCEPTPWMTLHTSGSTGTPKEIRVRKTWMLESARMTLRRLGLSHGDKALLCLPIDYVAGQMMLVRSFLGGLELICRTPSSHPYANLSVRPDFAALVPLQVRGSLENDAERSIFEATREVIVGGAAVAPDLADMLRPMKNHVWSTYGMTETLSHIALRPLSGDGAGPWYEPLPGIGVEASSRGTLAIHAPGVGADSIETNDLVHFEPGTHRFRVLGRSDNVIDSGGIKVATETLEETLQPHIGRHFAISSRPDPVLGESVVILIEGEDAPLPSFKDILAEAGLSPYWKPRAAAFVRSIPETRTGKPDRAAIRTLCLGLEDSDFGKVS